LLASGYTGLKPGPATGAADRRARWNAAPNRCAVLPFGSAPADGETVALHVRDHLLLNGGQRGEEVPLARRSRAERVGEGAVGDVHIRSPGRRGGLLRVLLRQRVEVALAADEGRDGQRGTALSGERGGVHVAL